MGDGISAMAQSKQPTSASSFAVVQAHAVLVQFYEFRSDNSGHDICEPLGAEGGVAYVEGGQNTAKRVARIRKLEILSRMQA